MTEPITFTVPAIPLAQPRQRHRIAGNPASQWVQNYTPKNSPVNAYKSSVRHAAALAYSGPPLDGPLRVEVCFVFPRPKAMQWKTRPMPRTRLFGGKDLDNLYKATTDALNGLTWIDDRVICAAVLSKWIAAGDEQPHCEITITPLTAMEAQPA